MATLTLASNVARENRLALLHKTIMKKAVQIGLTPTLETMPDVGMYVRLSSVLTAWVKDDAEGTYLVIRYLEDGSMVATDPAPIEESLATLIRATKTNGKLVPAPAEPAPAPEPTTKPRAKRRTPDEITLAKRQKGVVKFLTTKQSRESFYLKCFRKADPGQNESLPTVLVRFAKSRLKEAKVEQAQENASRADRCTHDRIAALAVERYIMKSRPRTKSRLQDMSDAMLARLVELVDLLEIPADIKSIEPQILQAIDKISPPAPAAKTAKPKKTAKKATKKSVVKASTKPAKSTAKPKAAPKVASKPEKPAKTKPAYSHKEECNPDGPSQLEKGNVETMDLRTARALRSAIDDAMHDIAGRFNLEYVVQRGVIREHQANYKIALETKPVKTVLDIPRIVHTSDTCTVSATRGKPVKTKFKGVDGKVIRV
jgi:hypothetical protein